jgi:hypothetical protein
MDAWMEQYALRFLLGGFAVSLFSLAGDVFRPKTFAGLFGAAPSIALSTLALAFYGRGPQYAATESRSMIVGAAALWLYCTAVAYLMQRKQLAATTATWLALLGWIIVAFGGRWLII